MISPAEEGETTERDSALERGTLNFFPDSAREEKRIPKSQKIRNAVAAPVVGARRADGCMTFISPRTDGRSHGAEHGSNFERFEPKSLFLDLILRSVLLVIGFGKSRALLRIFGLRR